MKYLIVFLSLFFASVASAQQIRINVHVVQLDGPNGLTGSQFSDSWVAAADHLSRSGVKLKLKKFSYIADEKPELATLGRIHQRLLFWRQQAKKRNYHRGVDLVHFIAPPIFEKNTHWFAGMAVGTCSFGLNATSISFAGTSATKGLQIKKSALGIAHEIAHILGGKHTSGNDFMHHGALGMVDNVWPMHVDPATINQIRRCQRRK